MDLSPYQINEAKENFFWFTSVGVKGRIIKIVEFQPMDGEVNRYNLALSDYINGRFDFKNVSDNKDINKLMQSIGYIVQHYTAKHPEREVFAMGDTPIKTRLYKMHISNYLEEIKKQFFVWGQPEPGQNFEEFIKGKEYSAFLVKRK